MRIKETDIVIIGAGPVGLMCHYLAQMSNINSIVLDKSGGPLKVGRADALNARTLQLLEIGSLFDDIYPLGLSCDTSSVWKDGKFISRQSDWWRSLKGCFHKHFLMLGQSHLENLLDEKLTEKGSSVKRLIKVDNIEIKGDGCYTTLNNGEIISSRYVVGADGSKSFVRNLFDVDFEIVRPNIIWAVIDGILDTDFPKVPEIIVFQAETADVAWIPREGKLDRFYVRMDTKEFSIEDAIDKINKVTRPYSVRFKEIEWFSQFSVRESVAENFILQDKIFLAGDAAHIHSVNGGQGLNTGISDAFNLIWKINMVMNHGMPSNLLRTYEYERKPVAKNVIEGSGELTRSTKFSEAGMHAQDYVKIIEKRAGYITGMGVEYSGKGLSGSRVFDFSIYEKKIKKRLYSILDYSKFTLLIVGDAEFLICMPKVVKLMQVYFEEGFGRYWTDDTTYKDKAILIRPDGHIESVSSLENIGSLFENLNLPLSFSIA